MVRVSENFANMYGTEELLAGLALGKVAECPFPSGEVKMLSQTVVVQCAATCGYILRREAADRTNTPVDFRFLQLHLTDDGRSRGSLG